MIWIICAAATLGVLWRPFHWPEAIWAVAGAAALVAFDLLTPRDALNGALKGTDVYLFLIGMMLLSETARAEGLFDWLASHATRQAGGSAKRLFLLIYGVGVVVTVFLSNDATAVVLTPAIAAAMKTAEVAEPLPFLLTSAFVANAASFVLPISNPANLVVYGSHTPRLLDWLAQYGPPSLLSIVATYLVLRWTQRANLEQAVASDPPQAELSTGGKIAAFGIAATSVALLGCSALDVQLGLPTAIAGAATWALVLIAARKNPWPTIKEISWSIIPLVAGLFVLVESLGKTELIAALSKLMEQEAKSSATVAAWGAGVATAFISNAMNNLPAGLVAAEVVHGAQAPQNVTSAVLIGVDLGPNLSVTGSLATILWLTALRREGLGVSGWTFLKLGILVMPPALALAIGGLFSSPLLSSMKDISMQGIGAYWLYPLIAIAGALQAWGPPMNGALRNSLSNPWLSSLVSFLPIVALLLCIWLCFPRPMPTLEGVQNMPWWAPLGGVIGAFAVVAGLVFVNKVGAGPFAAWLITANILMSLVIDKLGMFGMDQHPLNVGRMLGAALMVVGVALITKF